MIKFIKNLLNSKQDYSSKRFLAIFIYSPLIVVLMVLKYPIEYINVCMYLIVGLLALTSVEKFNKNDVKTKTSDDKDV